MHTVLTQFNVFESRRRLLLVSAAGLAVAMAASCIRLAAAEPVAALRENLGGYKYFINTISGTR